MGGEVGGVVQKWAAGRAEKARHPLYCINLVAKAIILRLTWRRCRARCAQERAKILRSRPSLRTARRGGVEAHLAALENRRKKKNSSDFLSASCGNNQFCRLSEYRRLAGEFCGRMQHRQLPAFGNPRLGLGGRPTSAARPSARAGAAEVLEGFLAPQQPGGRRHGGGGRRRDERRVGAGRDGPLDRHAQGGAARQRPAGLARPQRRTTSTATTTSRRRSRRRCRPPRRTRRRTAAAPASSSRRRAAPPSTRRATRLRRRRRRRGAAPPQSSAAAAAAEEEPRPAAPAPLRPPSDAPSPAPPLTPGTFCGTPPSTRPRPPPSPRRRTTAGPRAGARRGLRSPDGCATRCATRAAARPPTPPARRPARRSASPPTRRRRPPTRRPPSPPAGTLRTSATTRRHGLAAALVDPLRLPQARLRHDGRVRRAAVLAAAATSFVAAARPTPSPSARRAPRPSEERRSQRVAAARERWQRLVGREARRRRREREREREGALPAARAVGAAVGPRHAEEPGGGGRRGGGRRGGGRRGRRRGGRRRRAAAARVS